MAVTLKIGICDLFPEFLTNALVFLGPGQTAGAVTAGAFQTFFDCLYHFFVFIEPNSHGSHILSKFIIEGNEELSSNTLHIPVESVGKYS